MVERALLGISCVVLRESLLGRIEFHACSRRCRDRGFDERSHGRLLFLAGVLLACYISGLHSAACRAGLSIIVETVRDKHLLSGDRVAQ